MDFRIVFSKLLSAFSEQGIRYALMGGFAMGLWGVPRATVDIDFLVLQEDMDKVDHIMRLLGYDRRYHSENVSQYVSPLHVLGEVDYLHAFREASREMISRAADKELYDGVLKIRVLIPEDLIGLKLQAIRNNPSRQESDTADIKALLRSRRDALDWQRIERYCDILGMKDLCNTLREYGGEV